MLAKYLDNEIGQILVADKFERFLPDRRQIFVGRFYWQMKLANFIVRLTSALGAETGSEYSQRKLYNPGCVKQIRHCTSKRTSINSKY